VTDAFQDNVPSALQQSGLDRDQAIAPGVALSGDGLVEAIRLTLGK
jgi:hypothetical protein